MDTMHPQYCSRSALRRAPQQTTNSQSGIILQKCRLQGFRVRFGTGPHWKLPGKYVWAKLCRTLVLQKQVLTLLVIEVWSVIDQPSSLAQSWSKRSWSNLTEAEPSGPCLFPYSTLSQLELCVLLYNFGSHGLHTQSGWQQFHAATGKERPQKTLRLYICVGLWALSFNSVFSHRLQQMFLLLLCFLRGTQWVWKKRVSEREISHHLQMQHSLTQNRKHRWKRMIQK